MPSTYSPLLRVELQASGEGDTTWGDKTNKNLQDVLEAAIAGSAIVVLADADKTLTTAFGAVDEARNAILIVTGTLTAQRSVIVPASSKTYVVRNGTTGGHPITVKTATGTGVSIVAGASASVYFDGTNIALAQSPTADSSITPQKIDPTATYAWRFNGAFGLNRAQPHVPNYGAFSMDGTTGSYISLYQGGAQIGTVSATVDGLDLSSPGKPITFTTNGNKRITIENTGEVRVTGALFANTLTATGAGSFDSLAVTKAAIFGGIVTAAGFSGITRSNVISGLGWSPVQQGTGTGQNAEYAVKVGWSQALGRLKASVESTDLGNILFDTTPNVFFPMQNATGPVEIAHTQGINAGAATASIVLRERARAGNQGGGGLFAAPRIGFYWSGNTTNRGGQIACDGRDGVTSEFHLLAFDGSNYAGMRAQYGQFIGTVSQGVSDMRLKEKQGDVTYARLMLRKLSSFYYVHNAQATALGIADDAQQIGWSAQEVAKVLPQLVGRAPCDTDANGKSKSGQNYMTVHYERAVPVLSAAINEHDAMIEKQSLEIQRLHETVTVLMNRLAALENKQ